MCGTFAIPEQQNGAEEAARTGNNGRPAVVLGASYGGQQ